MALMAVLASLTDAYLTEEQWSGMPQNVLLDRINDESKGIQGGRS